MINRFSLFSGASGVLMDRMFSRIYAQEKDIVRVLMAIVFDGAWDTLFLLFRSRRQGDMPQLTWYDAK